MWRLCVAVLFLARFAAAQSLLLPEPRPISGVVVDSHGNPIADAEFGHAGYRSGPKTNRLGEFQFNTEAPTVVVRKKGYRGKLISTKSESPLRIALDSAGAPKPFPRCLPRGSYVGIDGWDSLFSFLRTRGIKPKLQSQDVDYGHRAYSVKVPGKWVGISHGSGPLWSFGLPLDDDVWRSTQYEEKEYVSGEIRILDARGQFADGTKWRNLGRFGESARYSDVSEGVARLLDKFLDSACQASP